MSLKERIQLDALARVKRGELTIVASTTTPRQASQTPGASGVLRIDDATNRCDARFYGDENLPAAFDVFGRWIFRPAKGGRLASAHSSWYTTTMVYHDEQR